MNPSYKGFYFTIAPLQPATEILIAELGELGFESFVETETGLQAFIITEDYHEGMLGEIQILQSEEFEISYTSEDIEQVNWNEEWEKNFSPIMVDEVCQVRAPFHPKLDTEFDIVIEPKMSFGTGHHATTHMMIQHILKEDWQDKKVLDMGCGTGVLAILSEMKGANPIDAIDIDNWCYLNTLENIERNNCKHISTYEGDAGLLEGKNYDTIIANINRNILLKDMATYANCLNEKGSLFLSGFYQEDLAIIKESCEKLGLSYESHLERDNWIAAKFVK
ncbi:MULTISPECIES: 50S ribosomal protein L11 methyltransferase [Mesonia]|uniref:Ribosomal protein L11 methyltransferase n=1 Tax=Mesonia oceanica TaxID=2687242 RepID=A0AC61YAP0_9FLAO|nr:MULTISPECIES: 50S ribosomal protein L11 methyltransferase [Mesonia]MAN26171.1 50S ribosomal protein L11 methyltransferase [Mesonia sp.]MAQ39539.1 50S ribosomal protein L11 methyltransferase [Mesonia sp.]MBJ96961.1 50S ribosomal protein L11 methyltransferase [Flavobacteriaceae bacterium]VVV01574.1 Ribosomal protein L11 methyltransferase [Mesonia oceanica]|tara:strand:+ start:9034 stop:9867 length:834 start_codon:yes stop_codon:yes gene_type:complete